VGEAPPLSQAFLTVGPGLPSELGAFVAEAPCDLSARHKPFPAIAQAVPGDLRVCEQVERLGIQIGVVECVPLVILARQQLTGHAELIGVPWSRAHQVEQAEPQVELSEVIALDLHIDPLPRAPPPVLIGRLCALEALRQHLGQLILGTTRDAVPGVFGGRDHNTLVQRDAHPGRGVRGSHQANPLVFHHPGRLDRGIEDIRNEGLYPNAPVDRAGCQRAGAATDLVSRDLELLVPHQVRDDGAVDPAPDRDLARIVEWGDPIAHRCAVHAGHVTESLHPNARGAAARVSVVVTIAVDAGTEVVVLAESADLSAREADLLAVDEHLHEQWVRQVRDGRAWGGFIEVLGVQIPSFMLRRPDERNHIGEIVDPVHDCARQRFRAILQQIALQGQIAVGDGEDARR